MEENNISRGHPAFISTSSIKFADNLHVFLV